MGLTFFFAFQNKPTARQRQKSHPVKGETHHRRRNERTGGRSVPRSLPRHPGKGRRAIPTKGEKQRRPFRNTPTRQRPEKPPRQREKSTSATRATPHQGKGQKSHPTKGTKAQAPNSQHPTPAKAEEPHRQKHASTGGTPGSRHRGKGRTATPPKGEKHRMDSLH